MPKTCFVVCEIATGLPRGLPNNWQKNQEHCEMENTSYRLLEGNLHNTYVRLRLSLVI